jgi:phosphoglycerate dehydrogenase-like enzyme
VPRQAAGGAEPLSVLLNLYSHRKIWNLPDKRDDELERRFSGLHFIRAADRTALRENLPSADVLFTWHLPPDLCSRARRLRWLHTPAAGIEHLLYPKLRRSDVLLTNSHGLAGDAMAEHLLALMLAFSRRLHDAFGWQQSQRWGQDLMWSTEPTPFRLSGKTVGIVGLGGIGAELARRAKHLGMRVIGIRRRAGKRMRFVDQLLTPDRLDVLLETSDFVVLAVPLTPETRGLIGARQLAKMKKSGYLLNVGRGEQINESALVRALRSGSIAGAALDVFQSEPLPRRSILWRVPNLLISPHYAGTYLEHMDRATDLFEENLTRFLSGRKLKNLVDKTAGY